MSTTSGGCLCGNLRYEFEGKADSTCHCHCRVCRRTTGAAVVTWTTVAIEKFRFTQGKPEAFHSTKLGIRQFCPECGSHITFQHHDFADYIDIAVNSLDNPDKMPPDRHIWSARQISWAQIDSHLPKAQEG